MCNCKDKNTLADDYNLKRTPHVHADVIKAWADGAVIEVRCPSGVFLPVGFPRFNKEEVYRVKPEPKPLTDLEKYGVEVGDVWLTHRQNRYCVTSIIHSEAYMTVQGVRLGNGDLTSLLFRRGVVNKL